MLTEGITFRWADFSTSANERCNYACGELSSTITNLFVFRKLLS